MQIAHVELLSGALDNLIRHVLTGCGQSARRAELLLDRLASAEDTDADIRDACERMRDRLEDAHV